MSYIKSFLRDKVEIRPFIRKGAGADIYGKPETRMCRIQTGIVLKGQVRDIDGVMETEVAVAKMFCVGDPIPVRSIVSYGDRDYIVLGCDVKKGFAFSHLEVKLG